MQRKHQTEQGHPTLSIRDLSIEFRRRSGISRVVDHVNIDVWPGEIVGIIGKSGSGKTLTSLSALQMLPKQARIANGAIHLGGTSLLDLAKKEMRRIRGNRIALIPQDAMQSLNPTMRIGRQVGEPLELHEGLSVKAAALAAIDLLKSVHIRDPERLASNYPHQFSAACSSAP